MKVIWKQALRLSEVDYHLPLNAKLIHVAMQNLDVTVWFECDSNNHLVRRKIAIYATGNRMPDEPGQHVGTVNDGDFVWHVYDHGEECM